MMWWRCPYQFISSVPPPHTPYTSVRTPGDTVQGDHRARDSYLISNPFKRLLFTDESQLIKTETKVMNILNTGWWWSLSCIQIIGTKWKFHACPASRYALRVSVGKNPRKLSLSGLHSGLSRDYRLDEVGNYYSPLSGVLNQDFRAEPAFCPPRGNLFAFLPLNSFLHHLDHGPGDSNCWAHFGNSGSDLSSFVSCRAHWWWHQDISYFWSWRTWVVSSSLLRMIIRDRDQTHVDIQFLCSLITS